MAAIHVRLVVDVDGEAESGEHAARQARTLEHSLEPECPRVVDHQPGLGVRHAAQFSQRMLDECHVPEAQRAHDHGRRQSPVEV